MKRLRRKVNDLVTADPGKAAGGLQGILDLLSRPYGFLTASRARLYRQNILKPRRLPCQVVSIGNITVGGTGKTPMTIYTARLLKAHGWRVSVISRGYRGRLEKTGGVVSNGTRVLVDAASAGDEPFLMAGKLTGIPVVVGRDRFQAGMLALKQFAPEVIVLDDAFQHLGLRRDLDLVLLDARRPFGNGRLLPGGPLREGLNALSRADALVLTRCPSAETALPQQLKPGACPGPVFFSGHRPYLLRPRSRLNADTPQAAALVKCRRERLRGKPVFAFSGIAKNDDFRSTLQRYAVAVKGYLEYPDHHWYSAEDVRAIQRRARAADVFALCTTEKDYVRLPPGISWPIELMVVGIDIEFRDGAFDTFVLERLQANRVRP